MDEDKGLLPGADELAQYSGDLIDVIIAAGVAKHLPKAQLSRLLKEPSEKLQAIRDYFEKQLEGLRTHKKIVDEVTADLIQIQAFTLFQKTYSRLMEAIDGGELSVKDTIAVQEQMLKVLQKTGGFQPRAPIQDPDSPELKQQQKDLQAE